VRTGPPFHCLITVNNPPSRLPFRSTSPLDNGATRAINIKTCQAFLRVISSTRHRRPSTPTAYWLAHGTYKAADCGCIHLNACAGPRGSLVDAVKHGRGLSKHDRELSFCGYQCVSLWLVQGPALLHSCTVKTSKRRNVMRKRWQSVNASCGYIISFLATHASYPTQRAHDATTQSPCACRVPFDACCIPKSRQAMQ
jgi:hypothetical protein